MHNLFKRVFTSIPLIIILCLAINNYLLLFFLLIIISLIALIEIFNIIKKIYYNKLNKFKIFNLYLISIFYLLIFIPQIFFFIINDFNNKLLFIYFLTVCIATDLGGYIFGKLFQGKKLIKISPKKTYSGLVGSYTFSIMVFVYFYSKFNYQLNFIFFTFLISTISQLGDLFISYLKRKAKLKDTGNILPGHGGILDRIDGIIFALPISINLLFLFE